MKLEKKKIQEQGGLVGASKAKPGYVLPKSIKKSRQCKAKKSVTQHISTEEIDRSEE